MKLLKDVPRRECAEVGSVRRLSHWSDITARHGRFLCRRLVIRGADAAIERSWTLLRVLYCMASLGTLTDTAHKHHHENDACQK